MTPAALLESEMDAVRGRVAMQLESLDALALHLVAAAAAWKVARRKALNDAADIVKKDARKQIGRYQPAVGIYPEWAPLAESTVDEKARLGVTPRGGMDDDAPLYRFGDLLRSFRSELVSDDEVVIGSTELSMAYHEFGTSKMPPRPVLGPAFVKNREQIQKLLGVAVIDAVLVGQHLGYRLSGGEESPEE